MGTNFAIPRGFVFMKYSYNTMQVDASEEAHVKPPADQALEPAGCLVVVATRGELANLEAGLIAREIPLEDDEPPLHLVNVRSAMDHLTIFNKLIIMLCSPFPVVSSLNRTYPHPAIDMGYLRKSELSGQS